MTDQDLDAILAALIALIEERLGLLTQTQRLTLIVRLCSWLGGYGARCAEAHGEATA